MRTRDINQRSVLQAVWVISALYKVIASQHQPNISGSTSIKKSLGKDGSAVGGKVTPPMICQVSSYNFIMRTNKYKNHSILNLLEIDLEQRMHENKLCEIDLSRRRIRSQLKKQDKHYDKAHKKNRVNRIVSNYLYDMERAQQINQMNRKINESIERQRYRPVASQFRVVSRPDSQRERVTSVVRSRSSISLKNRKADEMIQAENYRLMDRLLSMKPHGQYVTKESRKDFQKHLEYSNRIRKFSEANTSALLHQIKGFGVEPRLVLPEISPKRGAKRRR